MKSVGVLSFYPAFTPPKSGGELRAHHLYKQVGLRDFDVRMITPTYSHHEKEVVSHGEHFVETRFPKTQFYNKLHHFNARFSKFSECSGLVCSIASQFHREFAAEAKRLSAESDILVQECMFLTPIIPRRKNAGQVRIYDAQNVETILARQMYGAGAWSSVARAWLRRQERRMLRESDVVLVCSDEDADLFVTEFGVDRSKFITIPNGVDVDEIKPCPTEERRQEARNLLGLSRDRGACFFIGSFHPPNVEAVKVILNELADALSDVDFLIAGKVCEAFANLPMPANVRLLGLVDEAHKSALLHGCDVALNPMVSGGGTNLKMLDYLAAGLPVLSTTCGARGLALENGRHCLIREEEGLRTGLELLLSDSALSTNLGREGRRHVEENFSWRAIGDRMADVFSIKSGRRLILLNDYPVMPAQVGGQVRVEATAKAIAGPDLKVTILTLTANEEFRRVHAGPHLEELNVPRSFMHRRLDMRGNQMLGCGWDDVTALTATRWLTPEYRRTLRRELRNARAVLLSHPYMEFAIESLPRRIAVYYDSHNTEHKLKKQLYRKGLLGNWLVGRTRRAEKRAANRAAFGFCVSEENRRDLIELAPKFAAKCAVAPNGVDCLQAIPRNRDERMLMRRDAAIRENYIAVFLGSGHPPNAEAARVILYQIAPEHPNVLFLLVGNVNGWFHGQDLGDNVVALGAVSHDVKNYLLQCADFALNPMLTGSGTSLKLFDYLAHGMPVLTTLTGARGLDDEAMNAVVLCEANEMSARLRELIEDPARCERLSYSARELAEKKFDWSVALAPMRGVLQATK
ncbi:hypothetical protein BH09SUM1_BH09SUM1_16630 [soil metagenome]